MWALRFKPLSRLYAGNPCCARRSLIWASNWSTTEPLDGGVVLVGDGLGFGFGDVVVGFGRVEAVVDGDVAGDVAAPDALAPGIVDGAGCAATSTEPSPMRPTPPAATIFELSEPPADTCASRPPPARDNTARTAITMRERRTGLPNQNVRTPVNPRPYAAPDCHTASLR